MLNEVIGKVWYINASRKGVKVGVQMGNKVFNFLDEDPAAEYTMGEEMVVTVVRRSADATD